MGTCLRSPSAVSKGPHISNRSSSVHLDEEWDRGSVLAVLNHSMTLTNSSRALSFTVCTAIGRDFARRVIDEFRGLVFEKFSPRFIEIEDIDSLMR